MSLLLISWSCRAENTSAILFEVVDAVERLIGFYKASHQHLNLDGIFGLKILEGQVQVILDEHRQGKYPGLSADLVTRLTTMVKDTHWTGEQAVSAVRASDGQYYQDLAFIVAQPWTVVKKQRKVTPSLRWEIPVFKSGSSSKITESESDKCMMELAPLTNASKADARGQGNRTRCQISEQCALRMTKRGLMEYSITHQILWTALAEQMGCEEAVNTALKGLGFKSAEQMQEEWCANVYYEMLAVVHVYMSGTVNAEYQDIFMEQQFVCANLGFHEFLKKQYLDQILSWQLPSGCFGDQGGEEMPQAPAHSHTHAHTGQGRAQEPQGKAGQNKHVPHDSMNIGAASKEVHVEPKGIPAESNRMAAEPKHSPAESKKGNGAEPINNTGEKSKGVVIESDRMPVNSRGKPLDMNSLDVQQQQHLSQLAAAGGVPGSSKTLPGVPVHPAVDSDQTQQTLAPLGRRRDWSNQNIAPAQNVNANLPQFQYPNNQNRVKQLVRQDLIDKHKAPAHDNANMPQQPQLQYSNNRMNQFPAKDSSNNNKQFNTMNQVPLKGSSDNKQNSMNQFPAKGNSDNVLQMNVDPHVPPRDRDWKSHDRAVKDTYLTGQGTNRKLLREKSMPGQCLSHKTSVASGALVVYLRYLIESGPSHLFSSNDFSQDNFRSLLDHKASKHVANVLHQQQHKHSKNNAGTGGGGNGNGGGVGGGGGTGNGGGVAVKSEQAAGLKQGQGANTVEEAEEDEEDEEEEDEDEEDNDDDEDGDYEDGEELYPDGKQETRPEQQRRVVHFGANVNNPLHKRHHEEDYQDTDDNNHEDENDDYANNNNNNKNNDNNDNEDGDKEEEEGDYINRVKASSNLANLMGDKDTVDDDTEYTYYDDDDDNDDHGIIIRRRNNNKPQQPLPQKAVRIRSHHRHHRPQPHIAEEVSLGASDSPPTKTVVFLLSATSLLLIVFMYRFIRRRRVHLRHGARGFKL